MQASFFRGIFLLILELAIIPCLQATPPQIFTAVFNDDWLKVVVSIEQTNREGKFVSTGTGFLISTTNNHLVLVTAKHVVTNEDGSINTNLFYRLNSATNTSILVPHSDSIDLFGGWFLSDEADVACRIIRSKPGLDFKYIPVSAFLPLTNLEVASK